MSPPCGAAPTLHQATAGESWIGTHTPRIHVRSASVSYHLVRLSGSSPFHPLDWVVSRRAASQKHLIPLPVADAVGDGGESQHADGCQMEPEGVRTCVGAHCLEDGHWFCVMRFFFRSGFLSGASLLPDMTRRGVPLTLMQSPCFLQECIRLSRVVDILRRLHCNLLLGLVVVSKMYFGVLFIHNWLAILCQR